MKYLIRNFEIRDYDAVLKVWQQTNMGGEERGDNLKVIKNTLENGGGFFVLEEQITGTIVGTSWITNDSRRLYLHHFAISPYYQGRRLSHLLMEETMRFAQEKKLQIKLEVHKENAKACSLYQKYGFKYLGDYQVFIVRGIK